MVAEKSIHLRHFYLVYCEKLFFLKYFYQPNASPKPLHNFFLYIPRTFQQIPVSSVATVIKVLHASVASALQWLHGNMTAIVDVWATLSPTPIFSSWSDEMWALVLPDSKVIEVRESTFGAYLSWLQQSTLCDNSRSGSNTCNFCKYYVL